MDITKEQLIDAITRWKDQSDMEMQSKDEDDELFRKIKFLVILGFDVCELFKPRTS